MEEVKPSFPQHDVINQRSPGNLFHTLIPKPIKSTDIGFYKHLLNKQNHTKYVPDGNFSHTMDSKG